MYTIYSAAATANKAARSSTVKKINSTLLPSKSAISIKPVLTLDLEKVSEAKKRPKPSVFTKLHKNQRAEDIVEPDELRMYKTTETIVNSILTQNTVRHK